MAQEFLDADHRGSFFQQVGTKGVSEYVGTNVLFPAQFFYRIVDAVINIATRDFAGSG